MRTAKEWADYNDGWRDGLAAAVSSLNRQADEYKNDSAAGDVHAEDHAMSLREEAEIIRNITAPEPPKHSATCQWFEETELEDGTPYLGSYCGAPATHTACTPIAGGVVCEKHKCRCSKKLSDTIEGEK